MNKRNEQNESECSSYNILGADVSPSNKEQQLADSLWHLLKNYLSHQAWHPRVTIRRWRESVVKFTQPIFDCRQPEVAQKVWRQQNRASVESLCSDCEGHLLACASLTALVTKLPNQAFVPALGKILSRQCQNNKEQELRSPNITKTDVTQR